MKNQEKFCFYFLSLSPKIKYLIQKKYKLYVYLTQSINGYRKLIMFDSFMILNFGIYLLKCGMSQTSIRSIKIFKMLNFEGPIIGKFQYVLLLKEGSIYNITCLKSRVSSSIKKYEGVLGFPLEFYGSFILVPKIILYKSYYLQNRQISS